MCHATPWPRTDLLSVADAVDAPAFDGDGTGCRLDSGICCLYMYMIVYAYVLYNLYIVRICNNIYNNIYNIYIIYLGKFHHDRTLFSL